MNKKAFVARDWIIATILFSGLLVLATLSVGSLASDYGNNNVVDSEFAAKFNQFDDTVDRAGSMFDSTTDKEGLTLVGTFDILFSSTFTVISLVFGSVTAVGSQVAGFGEYFGIPTAVTRVFFTILLSALAVTIVFIVISSMSNREL